MEGVRRRRAAGSVAVAAVVVFGLGPGSLVLGAGCGDNLTPPGLHASFEGDLGSGDLAVVLSDDQTSLHLGAGAPFGGVVSAPDGSLLIYGHAQTDAPRGLDYIVKLEPDGRPDRGFGTGGVAVRDPGEGIHQLLVRDDGRVVALAQRPVLSAQEDAPGTMPLLWQLTRDGSPDPDFGAAGTAQVDLSVELTRGATAASAAILPDGSLLLVGQGPVTAPDGEELVDFAARIDRTGTLEERRTYRQILERWWAIEPDQEGAIVLGDLSTGSDDSLCFGRRLTADLGIDSGFGQGGWVQLGTPACREVVPLGEGRLAGIDHRIPILSVFDAAVGDDPNGVLYALELRGKSIVDVAGEPGGGLLVQLQIAEHPDSVSEVSAAGDVDPASGPGGLWTGLGQGIGLATWSGDTCAVELGPEAHTLHLHRL